MNGKFHLIPAVHIAAMRDGKVVLVRRRRTGFMDGYYDLASGHLEPGETIKAAAARELKEETGLETYAEDLELFNITQGYSTPGKPYLYLMFRTDRFTGEPSVIEPDLSDDVAFFDLANLPEKTVPHVKEALLALDDSRVGFGYVRPGQYGESG